MYTDRLDNSSVFGKTNTAKQMLRCLLGSERVALLCPYLNEDSLFRTHVSKVGID